MLNDADVVLQWAKYLTCIWLWLNLLNHVIVNYLELLFYCAQNCGFKLAPIFQLPVWTETACFTHSPQYKPLPFQVRVQIATLPASPGGSVSQEHSGLANMSDSKCVGSVSCCKIIMSSRTVLNYKHVLTVWSVKVNWGKNIDPKTYFQLEKSQRQVQHIFC